MSLLPKSEQECKRCASLAFSSATFFSGFLCVRLREKERACVFGEALQEEAYALSKYMGACSCFCISECASAMCLPVCDCSATSPTVPSRGTLPQHKETLVLRCHRTVCIRHHIKCPLSIEEVWRGVRPCQGATKEAFDSGQNRWLGMEKQGQRTPNTLSPLFSPHYIRYDWASSDVCLTF